jgi:hypothetical protein
VRKDAAAGHIMTERDMDIRRLKEAFKIALVFTVSLFIFRFFQVPGGNWIPLTVATAYIGGSAQGMVTRRSNSRIFGNFCGLLAAFLFTDIFMHRCYWTGYVLPLLWAAGFYLYFATGSYFIYTFIVVNVIIILKAVMSADQNWYVFEILFERMFCTGFAGLLVVAAEVSVFRREGSAMPDLRLRVKNVLNGLAEHLDEVFGKLRAPRHEPGNFYSLLQIYNDYGNSQNLASFIELELGRDIRDMENIRALFKKIGDACMLMRGMIVVLNHTETLNFSPEERETLSAAARETSAMVRSGVPDNEAVSALKSRLDALPCVTEKRAPEYFIPQTLASIAEAAAGIEAAMNAARDN